MEFFKLQTAGHQQLSSAPLAVHSEFNTMMGKELLQLACCSASGLGLSCLDKLQFIYHMEVFFFFFLQISSFSTYSKISLKQCFQAVFT